MKNTKGTAKIEFKSHINGGIWIPSRPHLSFQRPRSKDQRVVLTCPSLFRSRDNGKGQTMSFNVSGGSNKVSWKVTGVMKSFCRIQATSGSTGVTSHQQLSCEYLPLAPLSPLAADLAATAWDLKVTRLPQRGRPCHHSEKKPNNRPPAPKRARQKTKNRHIFHGFY